MADYQFLDLNEVIKEIHSNVISKLEVESNYETLMRDEVKRYVKHLSYRECIYIIQQYGFTRAIILYLQVYDVGEDFERSLVTFLIWREMIY